jgi:hypothetical protein
MFCLTSSGHTQICAPLRPSQNLDGQCSYTHITALTPNHNIFTSFVFFFFLTQRTVTLRRCQAMHQWLQRRDGNFYWVETHGFVWRWKKIIDKDWDYMAK